MEQTMKDRAEQYLEKKDNESGTIWTEDNDGIVDAFIDFALSETTLLKQQLSSLQADNERLREALLPLVNLSDAVFIDTRKDKEGVLYAFNAAEITYNDLRKAKAALKNK